MSNYNHFLELRKRYYQGVATPAEVRELIELTESGQFDTVDEDTFKQIWNNDEPMTDQDRHIYNSIYANIGPCVNPRAKIRMLEQPWQRAVAAAIVLILILAGTWAYKNIYPNPINPAIWVSVAGPVITKLPDGTRVELKKGSKLTYDSATFAVENRNARLTGTAFFDVTHNPEIPFKVYSGQVVTTVRGTAFNVTESSNRIEVVVVRGAVDVGDSLRIFKTILPHQKIAVVTGQQTQFKRDIPSEADLQWRKDNIVFNDIALGDAAILLGEIFNMPISINNESLKKCRMHARFHNNAPLEEILKTIASIHGASLVTDRTSFIIKGGKACN
jgi:transmembrane sensor